MSGGIWTPRTGLVNPHRSGLGGGIWPSSGPPVLTPPASVTFWNEARFDSAYTLSVGNRLLTVKDFKGGFAPAHDMTNGNGTTTPTISTTNGPNGYRYYQTDNLGTLLLNGLYWDALINGTNYAIWVIARVDSIVTDNDADVWNNEGIYDDASGYIGLHLKKTTNYLQSYEYAGDTKESPNPRQSITLGSWMRVCTIKRGAGPYELVQKRGDTELAPVALNALTVFTVPNFFNFHGGLAAMLTAKSPSDADKTMIDSYLKEVYGV